MWLLVLALALLGICCSGEESGDISGCCTHLAVTRWVLMVILFSSTFPFSQRGQRVRAPGEQTGGVQADRGPGWPADLQERAGQRILILSQGEMFLFLRPMCINQHHEERIVMNVNLIRIILRARTRDFGWLDQRLVNLTGDLLTGSHHVVTIIINDDNDNDDDDSRSNQ